MSPSNPANSAFVTEMQGEIERYGKASTRAERRQIEHRMVAIMRAYLGPGGRARRDGSEAPAPVVAVPALCHVEQMDRKSAAAGEKD